MRHRSIAASIRLAATALFCIAATPLLGLAATPLFGLAATPASAAAAKIGVVAAENFYGDVAAQVGGDAVSVASVMANPDEDPHLFETSPSTARLVSGAAIAISSGADYDPWMASLLAASASAHRRSIVVADLVGKKPGDNPHIWYDPATMAAFANAFADALGRLQPAGRDGFMNSAKKFQDSLQPLDDRIAALRAKYSGLPVAASEPVFGYMADRLGLVVREQAFQRAVMNDAEPAASDVVTFENDLKSRAVKALILNSQADDPAVDRLAALAKSSGVPTISVSELEPAGQTYQGWMLRQLDDLDRALSSNAR